MLTTKPYLDLCIESIQNLNYPKDRLEVIIVCHKVNRTSYVYDNVKVIYPIEDQFYNPRGLNFGMRNAAEDSDFYFMLNDDVILAKDCLVNLLSAAGDNPVILNPISPCDNEWLYGLAFGFEHNGEFVHMSKRFYRLPEVEGKTTSMMNAPSLYPRGIFRVDHLCMFCTLIPKKVWLAVGEFDENFKTGQDDIDFCLRARQKGVIMAVALDALAWHFGGVTADNSISVEKRKENLRYFKAKWGFLPDGVTDADVEGLTDAYKFENQK